MGKVLNRLEELLKKKGIGPEGSKSLKEEELNELQTLFSDPSYSLTTKATILTAILMLPASAAEQQWIDMLRSSYETFIPESLHFIITHHTSHEFQGYLCMTLSGTDLKYEDAYRAMQLVLNDTEVAESWKGAFLEAQRLKRESFDENKAFFDVLWKQTRRLQTQMPLLIDICDNYDGFNRYQNLAVFYAAALASCGYPSIVHGLDVVAPKYGVSTKQVIEALNGITNRPIEQTAQNIQDATIGWGYIDQSDVHPSLYQLKTIRSEMVKRPFLATFEKIMQPIRAINGNHIMTGYTHAHYRTEVAEQIKTQGKAFAAMVIKGLEGSSCPPLNRETVQVVYKNGIITDQMVKPSDFLKESVEQAPSKEVSAEQAAKTGLAALNGEKNEAFYQIQYYVSMTVSGFDLEEKNSILQKVSDNLVNGKAYQTLMNGLS